MGISWQSRKQYHPQVSADGTFVGGERNHQARLAIIEREVDFAGKRVLDLGCSGGFFSLSVARTARSVTGVDGDARVIEQNREAAKRLGLTNVEFLCERITPAFLATLERYDVVLFLSVFHHILVTSRTYDWNDARAESSAGELLRAIAERADTYVFEIGRPDECFDWAEPLGARIGEPRTWVPEHVFGPGFVQVKTLPGPAYGKTPFKWLTSTPQTAPLHRLARRWHRLVGVDQRDFREIYVGRRHVALGQ
jgi:SAM-dependent methyltransferase